MVSIENGFLVDFGDEFSGAAQGADNSGYHVVVRDRTRNFEGVLFHMVFKDAAHMLQSPGLRMRACDVVAQGISKKEALAIVNAPENIVAKEIASRRPAGIEITR